MNPSRRTVLKSLCFSAAALAVGTPRRIRFRYPISEIKLGVIADIHIGFVPKAEDRLQAFLDDMSEVDPDGLIQLGDFAYPNAGHQAFVDKINRSNKNVIHAIGNHELDLGLTRDDAKESWGIPHYYYTQELNGLKIIVLDGNDHGSPSYDSHGGYHSYVGEKQREWFECELESSELPILVVSHQPLAGKFAVDNAEQMQRILSGYRDKVLVCINGHSHLDQHVVVDGINYVHINSASYYWLGGQVRLAEYKDPLFTTLVVDPAAGTVTIEESTSRWTDGTPEDAGYFENGKNADIKDVVKPQISSREIRNKPNPVIDVFLMAGQSNMQGAGRVEDLPEEILPQPTVQIFHSAAIAGQASRWVENHPSGFNNSHFGPEISFGYKFSTLNPDTRIAIIKHATGGTDLPNDWAPGIFGQVDTYGIEYKKFVATVNSGLQSLAEENGRCKIRLRAMFWQQGEKDSKSEAAANSYRKNLRTLIHRIRQEFDVENLPFIYGKVHDTTLDEVPAYQFNDLIIEAQTHVDQSSGHKDAMSGAHVVESADFEVHGDVKNGFRDGDFAHLSSNGVLKLGDEYAKRAHQLMHVAKNTSSQSFRVITYNTFYVFDHQKQIEQGKLWVRSMVPDVVALQELTNIQPEKLSELSSAWGHEHSCLLKASGFSVGITSRRPLEVVTKRIEDMHHGYLHVRIDGIHYFVVHLSPFKFKKRRQETEVLLSEILPLINDGSKVIVLGDFNAFTSEDRALLVKDESLTVKLQEQDKIHEHVQNLDQGNPDYSVIGKFLSSGLVDSARLQVPFTKEKRLTLPTGIWGDKKTSVKSGQRVDFILVTPNLSQQILDTMIPTEGAVNQISDHYPVVTDFEIDKTTR